YWASVGRPVKYNILTQIKLTIADEPTIGGHHADYRCSIIINDGNKDRIIFGNDGGVGLVPDGKLAAPKIRTLNGDLSINLVHDMDVHPRTGVRLYAFQDNYYLYRFPNGSYSNSSYIGEGSAALIQQH
ncbi:MAG: hypothetical protein ACKO96_41265, partial [Flammeovirgaceae bacterium]